MKFTKEQLQKIKQDVKAVETTDFESPEEFWLLLKAKLTESEFDPLPTQVVFNRTQSQFTCATFTNDDDDIRPQTLAEHGPDVWALQNALEEIYLKFPSITSVYNIVKEALKHRIPE